MKLGNIPLKIRNRRGQMFILSTLIIALYIILITGVILEIRTDLDSSDLTQVGEVYRNFKNDINYRAVVDLARATSASVGQSQLSGELENIIIPQMVQYGLSKGLDVSITLVSYELGLNPSGGGYDSGNVTIEVIIRIIGEDTEIQDRINAFYGVSTNVAPPIVVINEFAGPSDSRPITDATVTTGSLQQNYGNGRYEVTGVAGEAVFTLNNGVVITVTGV